MINIFRSRTVWTVVVALVLTTLQSAHGFLDENVYLLCESVLTALAVYFRVNTRV